MRQKPNVWRIGNVTVTRIVDIEILGGHPDVIFQGLDPEQVRKIGWLQPHFADAFGMLNSSIHAFLIESEGKRISLILASAMIRLVTYLSLIIAKERSCLSLRRRASLLNPLTPCFVPICTSITSVGIRACLTIAGFPPFLTHAISSVALSWNTGIKSFYLVKQSTLILPKFWMSPML